MDTLNNLIQHPLTPIASGGAGIVATTNPTLQVVIAVISLLPSIIQLFKKKTTKKHD